MLRMWVQTSEVSQGIGTTRPTLASPSSVTITESFLGLGSNLGDRRLELQQAVNRLGESMNVECVSSVYDTAAYAGS